MFGIMLRSVLGSSFLLGLVRPGIVMMVSLRAVH